MAIMNPNAQELGQKLCDALGLPKNVRWFELRVAVDEAVTVKCEYFPESDGGELLESVLAEYKVEQKKPISESVEQIPAPPKPPLSRMIKDGALRYACCPKCSSTMLFKFWIFGQRKCVHPECGHVIG